MKAESEKRGTKCPIVQMAAVYMGLCLIATYMYAGGIFYVELLEKYQEGEVKTNLPGTLNTAFTSFLAPLVGVISTRYSCRVSIIVGGILVSGGLFLSSWASSILEIIVFYGVISGTGNAMVGPPLTVVLGYYVEKRREFFISMTASCIGLGMFIGTPAAVFLIDKYGISGTYTIFSGFMLHVCVFGVLCKPSVIEKTLLQDKKTKPKVEVMKSNDSINSIPSVFGKLQEELKNRQIANTENEYSGNCINKKRIFTSPDYILFLIGTFAWNYLLSVIQLHLPYYLKEADNTKEYISIIMSCFSISNAVGRLFSALLITGNRFNGLIIYFGSMTVAAIGTATFPWYSDMSTGPYMFGIMSGLMTGAPNGVMPAITLKIVDLKNMSTGYAVGCFFSGFGNIIGPVIASALFDYSGSYSMAFVLTGSVVFIGSICSLIAKILQQSKDGNTTKLKL